MPILCPPDRRVLLSAITMFFLSGAAFADPLAALQASYPGVRTISISERQLYITGARMTPGTTAAEAGAEFLAQHGEVFGVAALELQEVSHTLTRGGRFTVVGYEQRMRGREVIGGMVRILVAEGEVPRVTYIASALARQPSLGSEAPLVPPEIASALVLAQPGYGSMVIEGEPEQVVLIGTGARPDAWVWRVRARNPEVAPSIRSFFVDTAFGQVVHVQDEFYHATPDPTTTGEVRAFGTLGANHPVCPWCPYMNQSSHLDEFMIPGIRVQGTVPSPGGTGIAYTVGLGHYVLQHGTWGSALHLFTSLAYSAHDGEWYRIDAAPYVMSAEALTTVGSAGLLLTLEGNTSMPVGEQVSHVDVYLAAHRSREFLHKYIEPAGVSTRLEVSLVSHSCTALIQLGSEPGSLNIELGREDPGPSGCWSVASHSVFGHEYGHFVLYVLRPALGLFAAFHEGYADTFTHMLNDNSIFGPQHYKDGRHRGVDTLEANCKYPVTTSSPAPCTCTAHGGGHVLSGVWAHIRLGLKDHFGAELGLEMARELFGAWTLVTAGGVLGDECNSAHPGTLLEVVALVDEGSPEHQIVCDSFAARDIICVECCP